MTPLPNIEGIQAAAKRLKGQALRTPLISNPVLNERCNAEIWLKPECLQRTGSFKFRGAFNALSNIPIEKRSMGVVACSSGNHAQGVAAAARIFEMKAVIVMPLDAPQSKLERTRRLGAKLVTYDRQNEDRDEIAHAIRQKSGATFVHPYENFDVIAGQGTVGLEIAEDLAALNKVPDAAFVCCGGGGLTSGTALALKNAFPDVSIHPVEPEGFDDFTRSLHAGERVKNPSSSRSICDAILTPMPGEKAFGILSGMHAAGTVVSDDEVKTAMRFAFEELKLVVEPGGAVALAAILKNASALSGKTVACVLSGGNVDAALFQAVLNENE